MTMDTHALSISIEEIVRMSDQNYRLNEFALQPLGILHAEGWGPEEIEIDCEAGEVKFVFTNALNDPNDTDN